MSLRDEKAWGGAGVSVGTFAIPKTAAVEIGAFHLSRPIAERFVPPSTWKTADPKDGPQRWVGRGAVRLGADKAQITVLVGPKAFSIGFGLDDINGILFWLVR